MNCGTIVGVPDGSLQRGDERLQDRVVPDEGGRHTGLRGMTVDSPPSQWNVPATWKVKGAATLEGPWGGAVGGASGGRALPEPPRRRLSQSGAVTRDA